MDVFYHLDRTGEALSLGLVMQLLPLPQDLPLAELAMLSLWFPKGVGLFGLDIIRNQLHAFAAEL